MTPEPPVNVRLVYANNTVVPVDTVYVGLDENGGHQWRVINAPQALQIIEMRIETLPGNTSVIVDWNQ